MNKPALDVPYFSQWETPEMTLPVLAEGAAALHRDPLWKNSGAETIEEYARWAVNVCGMACLKMILAARGEAHPILSLARACTSYGGYVVDEADASIKGLIYAPFVTFVRVARPPLLSLGAGEHRADARPKRRQRWLRCSTGASRSVLSSTQVAWARGSASAR